jgi:hypothetical protein
MNNFSVHPTFIVHSILVIIFLKNIAQIEEIKNDRCISNYLDIICN